MKVRHISPSLSLALCSFCAFNFKWKTSTNQKASLT